MNILILSWRGLVHPNAGGAEISTHEHAKGWVKAGHKVILFTAYFTGAKKEEDIDGVHYIRRGHQYFDVQWQAFKWYLFSNHLKFDLVVDQFHGIPFFTPLYIKVKKLGFIHEVAKEVWKLNHWPKPLNLFPAALGGLVEPLIFKLFYKNISFMTVSDSTKNDLIAWGITGSKICVIHNGISIPKEFKLRSKEKEQAIIFLGALSKDKGIEDALQVFSILNQTENLKFWVVGKADANYLVKLKLLSKKLRIDKQIIFFGFVSEEKKFDLLSRAKIMVNTSVREGWGLVVIEGAYVATPTIGYNVAGLKDSIVDNKTGILCKVDPRSCAQQIRRILKDGIKYKSLQTNCVEWSKQFDWDKSVSESLKLIAK